MREPTALHPLVYAGGPCTCKPGRYVRFAIPPGVPGCEPVISCRANDGLGMDSITEHSVPAGAVFVVRLPSLDGNG